MTTQAINTAQVPDLQAWCIENLMPKLEYRYAILHGLLQCLQLGEDISDHQLFMAHADLDAVIRLMIRPGSV
jgi:hypothetical protein